ncbi:hypothetical protein DXG01_011100 [Tephrocybe rancida]|nr:hypothetical protein DXG01_011100 [Tephrocybe rancida]
MTDPNIAFYGFTPVARDPDVLFDEHPTASGDHPKQDKYEVTDFPLPSSLVVREVKAFVQKELLPQTFNHSHRVYVYGVALVKSHFPTWSYDLEHLTVAFYDKTYYLACLLHDIGTAERFLATTKLSFEFKGAIVARDLILKVGGVEDQADSVCDAIVRHQDIFVKGAAFSPHAPRHSRSNLLHPALIETTCAAFPRNGWSDCFGQTIERELALKPWCHTSTFEVPNWKEGMPSKFASDVRGNDVMRPYD